MRLQNKILMMIQRKIVNIKNTIRMKMVKIIVRRTLKHNDGGENYIDKDGIHWKNLPEG